TPATTPATTSPSTAPPATTSPTAEAAVTADTTTTLVVGALPQPTPTASIERVDTEALFAEVERCRTEQRIVFVSLQAFVNETGAHPSGPDSLAANGWLEPHPDGWSPRWAFDYSMEGIAVVPVAGGECDL
ncbi:MAG: hypothetical protein ACN4IE_07230, partial [Ilumatobacter sp.]